MQALRFCLVAVLIGFVASPGLAQDLEGEPYVAVHGGFNLRDDGNSDAVSNAGVSNSIEYDSDLNASLSLGYDLAELPLRPALELGYISSDVDRIKANGQPLGPQFLRGDLEGYNVMGNLFYDQELTDTIDLYLGGGAGVSYLDANFAGTTAGVTFDDDSDTVFAYQFLAGFGWHYSEHTVVDLGYRYWDSQDPDYDFGTIEGSATHIFEIGLRYKF